MTKGTKTEQADKAISKMEAMRRTLAQLGQDAKPLEIQAYVESEFGIDMNTNVISAYKSMLKAKKPAAKAAKAATAPAANGAKAAHAPASKPAGGISMDDIRAIKEMADRIGANKVKELADVLGK